ncbi:AAA family ATPase [Dactylosporangium siamense]|uniref:AAA+ ATPase domain-containing protein n=1 Tax=Dactylosporangium siamense TaxID=685454 RepID=A0A919PVE8_9ACTN|nr:AAA family ATPase [Dactylosporangium siamense]GIG50001.1 hypothetical protein Dsi01nite_080420 [Dactylosporangium siamense]
MTKHLDPRLRRLALTFAARLTELGEGYVSREEAVQLLGLSALCREHILLIGPPGTAKTALVEEFSRMLQAKSFAYLLTRFTEPAELFGAIDVRSFQKDGTYHVNTEGMLPRAEFVFLDELFHGSSAILNTLLTLVNERVFYNGAKPEPAALQSMIAASNDLPDDPTLLAFCDRFLFRCRLDYVGDDAIERLLTVGWEAEQHQIRSPDRPAREPDTFELADLRTLQAAVADVDVSPVVGELSKILLTLREEAVQFSDRRAVKAQKAIAASALLAGRGTAESADLGVLASLWNNAYDETAIRRVLEGHGVAVADPAAPSRTLEEVRFDVRQVETDLPHVVAAEEHRHLLRRLGRLLAEVRAGHPQAHDLLGQIQQAQTRVLRALQDLSGEEGFDV